jgi:regulatory protein
MATGLTPDFLQRVMKYCARSERCTHDVLIKLTSWGVEEEARAEILKALRQENFLNDERFIHSYVNE